MFNYTEVSGLFGSTPESFAALEQQQRQQALEQEQTTRASRLAAARANREIMHAREQEAERQKARELQAKEQVRLQRQHEEQSAQQAEMLRRGQLELERQKLDIEMATMSVALEPQPLVRPALANMLPGERVALAATNIGKALMVPEAVSCCPPWIKWGALGLLVFALARK